METKRNKEELAIFEYLDKDCRPDSTPIPHKMVAMPVKVEIFGVMSRLICEAFKKMRKSGGKSNWECDAKHFLGTKISEKRTVTANKLRKFLMECQGANLIEYSKEIGDEIIVKINVIMLFSDILKEASK